MEGEDNHLAGQTEQIRKWHEHGHRQDGLAAQAGHRNMDQRLCDDHSECRRETRKPLEWREHSIDERVDDEPLLQHGCDRSRETDKQRCISHRPKAPHIRLCGTGDAHPRDQSDEHPHDEEGGRHLFEVPTPVSDSHHHHGEGSPHQTEHDPVATRQGVPQIDLCLFWRNARCCGVAHGRTDPQGKCQYEEYDSEKPSGQWFDLSGLLSDQYLKRIDRAVRGADEGRPGAHGDGDHRGEAQPSHQNEQDGNERNHLFLHVFDDPTRRENE